MILTQPELKDLTGRVRWTAQARVLRDMGFEVRIRPDGYPVVDREHYNAVMCSNSAKQAKKCVLNLGRL